MRGININRRKQKDSSIWGVAPNSEWDFGEWQRFERKLLRFSLEELRRLINSVGIKFIPDNKTLDTKEAFILVMDEASKKDLLRAYKEIIRLRKRMQKSKK